MQQSSWRGVAGKPNAACNKGHPSCIGKGLRQKLSKHVLVLSTPEAYTSNTCSICQSECGPCQEVDRVHQLRRFNEATTDEERHRATLFSVRGLRHCHNVDCAAHLNRDHNAAINIQRRCETLLANLSVSPSGSSVEQQLEVFQAILEPDD